MKLNMFTKTAALLGLAASFASVATSHAVSLSLETANKSGFINGAWFTNTDVGSTGTGVIQSFVRVQDNGVADGYNASARPVMTDVNTSPTFTHDILLGAVPLVNIGGISYYEFLLDINQTTANPTLSLDMIQIYTRSTALTSADELSDLTGGGSTLRYNLDTVAIDNEILLNYTLNSGSGSGDMFAYIPQSNFGGALSTDYLYFYSQFGSKTGYTENDGFEEWAVRTPTVVTNVPDGGATLALFGAAMSLVGLCQRFAKKA